ncbi:hypothetical protein [Bradyrhizobium sp. AZCC 2289]|uniref:hypothetical protein n=1 Tax=Bradyrhizobium sp. AZCC 2289 TaxID=3117026 RepID=UPI002FEEE145
MADSPIKAERRNELWEAYLRPVDVPSDPLERHKTALEKLHLLKALHLSEVGSDDVDKTKRILANAFPLWSLISAEIGEWILSCIHDVTGGVPDGDLYDRVRLGSLLKMQEAASGPPTHRDALDPATVIIPRQFLLEITDALLALDRGEVRPIFEHRVTGEHGAPHAWSTARTLALEHVAFLVGQGVKKGIAQARVGAAIGASKGTLEDWEKKEKQTNGFDETWRVAKEAGALSIAATRSPTMDSHVLYKMNQLQSGTLRTFGEHYKKHFGSRHNQVKGERAID